MKPKNRTGVTIKEAFGAEVRREGLEIIKARNAAIDQVRSELKEIREIRASSRAERQKPEHALQAAFFSRVRGLQHLVPELALVHSPRNDFKRKKGQNSYALWNYLKAEGVVSGIPDICFPMQIGIFSAFYMELKAKGKSLNHTKRLSWNCSGKQGTASVGPTTWRTPGSFSCSTFALCWPNGKSK